jgi:hypothetical protein
MTPIANILPGQWPRHSIYNDAPGSIGWRARSGSSSINYRYLTPPVFRTQPTPPKPKGALFLRN